MTVLGCLRPGRPRTRRRRWRMLMFTRFDTCRCGSRDEAPLAYARREEPFCDTAKDINVSIARMHRYTSTLQGLHRTDHQIYRLSPTGHRTE